MAAAAHLDPLADGLRVAALPRLGLHDRVGQRLQVIFPLPGRLGIDRQAHHIPASRGDQPGSVLLTQVVAVRLYIRGQRAEYSGGIPVHVGQRVNGRMLARGARAATGTHRPTSLTSFVFGSPTGWRRVRVRGYLADAIRPRAVAPPPPGTCRALRVVPVPPPGWPAVRSVTVTSSSDSAGAPGLSDLPAGSGSAGPGSAADSAGPGPGSAPGPGPVAPAGRPRAARRRDRHGRGLRGRLVPPSVPLYRSRSQQFDDLVLEAVARLEARWEAGLSDVEFAVQEVPDADLMPDGGGVPLARVLRGSADTDSPGPRIVLFRRPLLARAEDEDEL